jgi:hypothetical protein
MAPISAVVVTGMIYLLSPIFALYQLGLILEAGDPTELHKLVDVSSVQRSLSEQIGTAFNELTKKIQSPTASIRKNPSQDLKVADWVTKWASPDTLTHLLGRNRIELGANEHLALRAIPVSPSSLASTWQILLNSKYRGTFYYVLLPPQVPPAQRSELKFRVIKWRWRVTAIQLPQELLERLVKAFAKATMAVP